MVNVFFQSESTALHVAATKNQDQAAKILLDTHKCDYNLKNKVTHNHI